MKVFELEPIFEKISDLINEAQLEFDEQVIRIRQRDPAHVSMVVFEMKNETKIRGNHAVNMGNFKQILRMFRRAKLEEFSLDLVEIEEEKILKVSGGVHEFYLPTVKYDEYDEREQKIPIPDDDVVDYTLVASDFDELILGADVVAEFVKFDKDGAWSDNDQTKYHNTISFPAMAKYSLEYLKRMSGFSRDFPDLVVRMIYKKDYLLKLSYIFSESLKLDFYLAPRVEN